jgi:hypothetical protein
MNRILLIAAAVGAALLFPLVVTGGQSTEEISKEKILATGPEWQDKYDKYNPPAEMVDALKAKLGANMKIDVYLGIWCPDSRNNVPPFLKILDRVGVSVPVRYFGVPRKPSRDVKYYVEEMNVERVPSFIFYRDGKEIGRIIENPKAGMIEDMMDIVFK